MAQIIYIMLATLSYCPEIILKLLFTFLIKCSLVLYVHKSHLYSSLHFINVASIFLIKLESNVYFYIKMYCFLSVKKLFDFEMTSRT